MEGSGREEDRPAGGAWLAYLLQTTDSLFPTGAYAHSAGLESLVTLGLVKDAASLREFLLRHAIPALERYELPYLGFAHAAATAGDCATLVALDQEYGAGKLARETREASSAIGTQRLRMLLRLEPTVARPSPEPPAGGFSLARAFAQAVTDRRCRGHAVIVCGLQAYLLGIPAEAAMTAYAYGSLAGYCSAALKLIRVGQEGVQMVLADVLGELEGTVRAAGAVTREDAGWSDPVWEIAAARHERAFARLFIS
jgi:urease accessory protein